LQTDITTAFTTIYKAALSIVPPADYKDPYTLDKIVNQNPDPKASAATKDELIKKLQAISPSFNAPVWDASVNCGQVVKLLKDWNWAFDVSKPDPAKYFVDKYDFNGDGRLSPREFLVAMIDANKGIIGQNKCTNCLEDVVSKKIDPMFFYLDCTNTNLVGAEELWQGFVQLKRSPAMQTKYNMYQCTLDQGQYRTTAVNDFILKSKFAKDGKNNRDEFRVGLLLGYWDRHTDDTAVYPADERNMKKLRWSADGSTDLVCERIKANIQANANS